MGSNGVEVRGHSTGRSGHKFFMPSAEFWVRCEVKSVAGPIVILRRLAQRVRSWPGREVHKQRSIRSARGEPMNGFGAISLAGAEDGRGELGVMHRIGMMLRLQAEAVETVIAHAVFAF